MYVLFLDDDILHWCPYSSLVHGSHLRKLERYIIAMPHLISLSVFPAVAKQKVSVSFWERIWIRISIKVKSQIGIRIKVKLKERKAVDAHKKAWRVCRPVVAHLHNFDGEQGPDPPQSETGIRIRISIIVVRVRIRNSNTAFCAFCFKIWSRSY
jgi:hypothetical protein